MSNIKQIKLIRITILKLIIIILINSAPAQDELDEQNASPILSVSDINQLIKSSIDTNIKSYNNYYINYYDYYYIINIIHRNTIGDFLDITELPTYQEEPDIEDDGKMIVNINLNYEAIGFIVNIINKGDDILFLVEDLISFDVNRDYLEHGTTQIVDEALYVSLHSLPGSRYHLDINTQVLTVNFPPGAMKQQHFDANGMSTVNEFSSRVNGAYLNYDITLSNSPKQKTVLGIQELNFFTEKGTGTISTFAHKDLTGKNTTTKVKRLESYWVTENEENLTRWNYGDSITYSAPWSDSTRFGGVQYSSNFSIKPGIITHPLINFNGSFQSPGDISVYSDARQIYNNQLKTGNFDIDNLPLNNGRGELVVKLKDITGKLQTIAIPYYNVPDLLNAGLSDFSYAIGMKREKFSINSNKYKNIITSFDYMQGIDNDWTAGAHFESMNDVFSLGFSNINKLGLYGAIQTSLANTHRKNLNSQRAKIEYAYQGKHISFFTGVTFDKDGFPGTFTEHKDYHKIKGLNRSYQTSIGYGDEKFGSLFFSINSTKIINENSVSQLNIFNGSYSKDITPTNIIMLNFGTDLGKQKKNRNMYITLSYIMSIGDKSISANVARRSSSRSLAKSVSFNSPSQTVTDWTYNASLEQDGKHSSYDIMVGKNTSMVDTSFYFFKFDNTKAEQLSLMGSVVEIDKSIHFARPIDNSIALVKADNFKDIPVYVNNNIVGKTNAHGQILIPNLSPYNSSKISMDVNKIPLDARFSYLDMFATPHWKSGTIISFDIKKQRSLQMTMLDSSHNPLEVNRILKIDGIADEVLVGYNGLVYIEDIKNLSNITGTSCDDDNRCCSFNIPLNIYEKDEIINLDDEICK